MSQLSHAQFPLRRHPDLLVDHRRARSAAVAEPRGANDESRDRLRWPASFRNGGRNQIGTVADIKSQSRSGLPRSSQWVQENVLIAVAAGSHDGTSGLQGHASLATLRKEIERTA